jgi:hypothetical protein
VLAGAQLTSVRTDQMPEPRADVMSDQLEHLFGGQLDGRHDGLVELAWTDAASGKLSRARLFGTDELEELVELACDVNRSPGQNVYVGAALRKPGTSPSARSRDDAFFALTAFYADLDDDVMESARTILRERRCPPTAVAVTGRHPHVRAQCLWRQETPITDPDHCRRQHRALAQALSGDPSVVNPGRLLRLAGSIAWPTKPGRIVEVTEFHLFDDGGPKVYLPGQVQRAFPLDEALPGDRKAEKTDRRSGLKIGSRFQGVCVEACIESILAGHHWHDNMVRLVGHWISRGWSDAEILIATESMTLQGYTVGQTHEDVARMIEGGRKKWRISNPAHEIASGAELPPLAPAFLDQLNVAMLPRRRWLLKSTMLRGCVTINVAPPGVGKSTLGIEQGIALITGREITGQKVYERTKVWIYNNEDDNDELKRRLAAVLQHFGIPFAEVSGRLALNSGADRPLLVAKTDGNNVIRLPDVDACIEHIQAHHIGAFFVDPFAETHEVNENANEQIKAVAAMFREIARRGNCAVMLVHHTAKPPQGSSEGHAGNLNTARGASALVGVARVVQTLFAMSPKDAEHYGVPPDERPRYIRLDDAKANMSLISGDARWFRRESVTIANGDEVGVLVPEELAPVDEAEGDGVDDLHRTIIAALLAQVPEDDISLNAAAVLLAWSGDARFDHGREIDKKGHRRARRPFRNTVQEACRRGICIVSGGISRGFTCGTSGRSIILRRFETPVPAADFAARQSEFTEDV